MIVPGYDHPVAYYSRKFLPKEQRYSTVEKECLAIKLGVQAVQVYLLGRNFTIQTDHHSLVWLDRLKESNARLSMDLCAPTVATTVSKSSIDRELPTAMLTRSPDVPLCNKQVCHGRSDL